MGPYVVKHHHKNDITRTHLTDPTMVKQPFVGEVSLWTSTEEEAKEATKWDHDVYVVTRELALREHLCKNTHGIPIRIHGR